MLKSLLLGLDDTEDSIPVIELGLSWATRFGALAVGLPIRDRPRMHVAESAYFSGVPPWPVVGSAGALKDEAGRPLGAMMERFVRLCAESGVACRAMEDLGAPYVRLLRESQRFHLVVIGRAARFDCWDASGSEDTLSRIVQDCPRPVVAVPRALGAGSAAVIAYDGSLQAARTLHAFEASGLGLSRKVHVVSIAPDPRDAARNVERATEYLSHHGIEAEPRPIESSMPTADLLLDAARTLDAGLLIMGAYGRPALGDFALGSVTRAVLRDSPVPVFCFH